jgi:hypothetical protein
VPAEQLVQLVEAFPPLAARNIPAVQSEQLADELLPVPAKYEPAEQFVQLEMALPPVLARNVPAWQSVQFDVEFPPVLVRYVPEEQFMHEVIPALGW